MDVDLFLLADAASGHEGKLFIHGGGITRIDAPALPWLQPVLAVVARFRLSREDLGQPQEYGIVIRDPAGKEMLPGVRLGATVEARPDAAEGEETFVQFAVTIGPIVFAAEGLHRFELEFSGEVGRSVNLPVVLGAAAERDPPSPATAVNPD